MLGQQLFGSRREPDSGSLQVLQEVAAVSEETDDDPSRLSLRTVKTNKSGRGTAFQESCRWPQIPRVE
jgi:hypothetical protein